MQLEAFLDRKGVCLEEVVAEIHARLRPVPGDVLFICGSLLEGLGNEASDVDLYLLTSREDICFTSLDAVLLAVGSCLIDVRVMSHATANALIESFCAWSRRPRQPRSALGFAQDQRKFLHGLHAGRPVFGAGSFESLHRLIDPLQLARHKLDWARCHADALQVDLAGLRKEGDRHTLQFMAQELLSHAADAILAGHLKTNPTGKWRVRQLFDISKGVEISLPGRLIDCSLGEHFLRLHRAPKQDDTEAAHQHALRIASFTRRAFFWAEGRLLRPSAASIARRGNSPAPGRGDQVLPHLDLDVTLRGDLLELYRLQGSGQIFPLRADSAELLCLFDGETTLRHAVHSGDQVGGAGQGFEMVAQLLALVSHHELAAKPMHDVSMLEQLLGRRKVS